MVQLCACLQLLACMWVMMLKHDHIIIFKFNCIALRSRHMHLYDQVCSGPMDRHNLEKSIINWGDYFIRIV